MTIVIYLIILLDEKTRAQGDLYSQKIAAPASDAGRAEGTRHTPGSIVSRAYRDMPDLISRAFVRAFYDKV